MPTIVDLPDHALVEAFTSPAFETRPPDLRNAELIPASLRTLYEQLWNQQQPAEDVICTVLPDAIVHGPGLVFDRDLNLIRQSIHQTSASEIEAAFSRVRHISSDPLFRTRPGVTLLCEKSGVGNYGHWLVEMLPIPYMERRRLVPGGWQLRLPASSAAMNAVMQESVELLGIASCQCTLSEPHPQRYEQLVVMTGLTRHGIRYSPLVIDSAKALAASVPAGAARKIWFSRAGRVRSLFDEHRVCERLAVEGWLVVDPATLTLREQIALAKGAHHLAGVNGAGLTNLVFAAEGARVTAFMPATMPDVFFWMLAGFKQQNYREVRCRQQHMENGWECSLLIDVEDVLAQLA